jgi:O-antigen/teichoic acid export membrane protein
MIHIGKSMILKSLTSLCIFTVIISNTRNVSFGVMALALSWSIICFYDVSNVRYVLKKNMFLSELRFDILRLKICKLITTIKITKLNNLVLLGIPMGFVATLNSLNINIPRYIIERNLGTESLGIFTAIISINALGIVIISALGQSSIPKLSRHYVSSNYNLYVSLFSKLLFISFGVGIFAVAGAFLFGKEILLFLFDKTYATHHTIFAVSTIGAATSYISLVLGYGVTSMQKYKIQLPLYFVSNTLYLILSMFLIPKIGLDGAIYSYVIDSCFQSFLLAITLIYSLQKMKLNSYKVI